MLAERIPARIGLENMRREISLEHRDDAGRSGIPDNWCGVRRVGSGRFSNRKDTFQRNFPVLP